MQTHAMDLGPAGRESESAQKDVPIQAVLRIRIQDPVLFDPWIQDPE
jgi:hypothetical protein